MKRFKFASSVVTTAIAGLLFITVVVSASALPDLDVVYITRTPRYMRYVTSEVKGLNPDDPQAAQEYVTPDQLSKQHWPQTGDKITFTAVVNNPGDTATGNFAYKWYMDGVEVASGTLSSIAPGGQISASYKWVWDSVWNNHNIKFVADPEDQISEVIEANNSREDRTNALCFCIPVWKSVYDWFNANIHSYNPNLNSFEDWFQLQMGYINQMFQNSKHPLAPNGVLERVRLDMIEIVPDSVPDPGQDHLIDRSKYYDWDCAWGFGSIEYPGIFTNEGHTEFLTGPFMWVIHEFGHQLGLPDMVRLSMSDARNSINGQSYFITGNDLMVDVSYRLSAHTAYALNSDLHTRRRHYGAYLYDLPKTCKIRMLDSWGRPLSNAAISFYQEKEESLSAPATFTATTDAEGVCTLPNRYCYAWDPVNDCLSTNHTTTTVNGHTLHDNPWGEIDIVAANGSFLCEISMPSGDKCYQYLTIMPFNMAYWAGYTDSYTYDVMTTMQPQNPTINDLYGVKMISADLGYAVGTGGMILKWNGNSWSAMSSPVTTTLRAVDANSESGIACAVGDGGTVVVYSEGSWTKKTIPNIYFHLRTCVVMASGEIFIGGDSGSIFRSSDGGKTWTMTVLTQYNPVTSIAFIDSLNGIAATMSVLSQNVFYTHDGGVTWLRSDTTNLSSQLLDVSMYSETEAYMVNELGVIYRTVDGGQTWTKFVNTICTRCIDIKPRSAGWACGIMPWPSASPVWRLDGNDRCEPSSINLEINSQLNEVSCVSGDEAWAVGNGGLLLHLIEDQSSLVPIPDTTAPVMGTVADSGVITFDATNIIAKWSATDLESGVVEYKYAIGASPTDPGSGYLVDWRSCQEAFTANDLSGLGLTPGGTYYYYVKARNRYGLWSEAGVSDGITIYIPTTGKVKLAPSSTPITLTGRICTGSFGSCFYIEEPDRSSGIRVEVNNGPAVGDLVTVSGKVQSLNGEAAIVQPVFSVVGTSQVEPVSVTNKSIGGCALGLQSATWSWRWINSLNADPVYQLTEADGLNNTGLLVKTTGTVTYIDPTGTFAYIDDGSGVYDGNTVISGGAQGIRIGLPAGIRAPKVGSGLTVTGVVGTNTTNSKLTSAIRLRRQADIQSLSGAIILGNISKPTLTFNQLVQSPHPYKNSWNYAWSVTTPTGTSAMRLHFNQIEVVGADWVYYMAPGGTIHTLTNVNLFDFWTDWVPGNKVNFGLQTDATGAYYGLRLDKYEGKGSAVSNVTITLRPGNITTTTDAKGNFTFTNVPDGTYTLTPTFNGMTLTPSETVVIVQSGELAIADFTGN